MRMSKFYKFLEVLSLFLEVVKIKVGNLYLFIKINSFKDQLFILASN